MSQEHKKFQIDEENSLNMINVPSQKDGNDEHWFRVADVAAFLGYENLQQALKDNNISEEWQRTWSDLNVPEGNLELPENWQSVDIFISETGLYALLARSSKPKAEEFISWLYAKLLPEFSEDVVKLQQEFASARIEARQREESPRENVAMLAHGLGELLVQDSQQALREACLRRQELLKKWQGRVVPVMSNEVKEESLILFKNCENLVAVARIQSASSKKKIATMQSKGFQIYRSWDNVASAIKLWLATRKSLEDNGVFAKVGSGRGPNMTFRLEESKNEVKDEDEVVSNYIIVLGNVENLAKYIDNVYKQPAKELAQLPSIPAGKDVNPEQNNK